MAFTSLSSKSVGGNITRAEVVDLLDNLRWFYTPPAYRLYNDGTAVQATTTSLVTLDYIPSGGAAHYEWLEGGGGDPDNSTYWSLAFGLYVNVGDVAAGIWINGVMAAIENPPTTPSDIKSGTASASYTRRLQLRRGDGSTWTEMGDIVQRSNTIAKRTSFHVSGLGDFTTGTDRVEARVQQNTSTNDVISDRRWGVRLGEDTNYNHDYASARQISDTNSELINNWNQLRLNQLRIESRPSGQRYATTTTSITANVDTQVTLGGSDWASDSTIVNAASNTLTVQQAGLYLVQGQVTFDSYNASSSFAVGRLKLNGSTNISSANSYESNNYDTTVSIVDIAELAASDAVTLYATSGTNSTVQASRGTYLTLSMMSSDDGVDANRQVWARMPDPTTWPDVANYSSEHLSAGTLRTISDLTDRIWHRPAFKAESTEEIEIEGGDGWADVDVDTVTIDYTDLEGTHGYSLLSGGSLVLPWGGIWLVGGRITFGATTVDGENVGNQGLRGVRIAINDGRAVGAIIDRGMNGATATWTRTLMETVVINRDEGAEVTLQGLVMSATDFGALPVTAAHLWAVELGEDIVRDPR